MRYNNNKGKRAVAIVHGAPAEMMSVRDGDEGLSQGDYNQHCNSRFNQYPNNMNLTGEQNEHLMNLAQHFQAGNNGEGSSNSNANGLAVNFAGRFNEEASGDW
ncbi:hypothetical protein K7X08_032592 [Anisodus acutangulus]|uniref:Uncharacterized protein n=1 Tax=Anisodus acutangulus TaxID=402998 RepID=A0A9Q1MUM1_9SOLA|nr:hypothetical protein K7X08_032592 [Anisodus acutangulus]